MLANSVENGGTKTSLFLLHGTGAALAIKKKKEGRGKEMLGVFYCVLNLLNVHRTCWCCTTNTTPQGKINTCPGFWRARKLLLWETDHFPSKACRNWWVHSFIQYGFFGNSEVKGLMRTICKNSLWIPRWKVLAENYMASCQGRTLALSWEVWAGKTLWLMSFSNLDIWSPDLASGSGQLHFQCDS